MQIVRFADQAHRYGYTRGKESCINNTKKRPTEFEQLISDYHRDNKKILRQKYKWLTPKPKPQEREQTNEKTPIKK